MGTNNELQEILLPGQLELLDALEKQNLDKFKELLPKIDINYFYGHPDHGTILYIAASKGLLEFTKLSIDQRADVNGYNEFRKDTPLHAACKAGHNEVVKLLLAKEASISEKDVNGRQPLHVTALINNKENRDVCLKTLLDLKDMKKYINTKDISGSTALHLALINNYTDAAKMLLDYGANPYISPDTGKSVEKLIQKQLPEKFNSLPPRDKFNDKTEDTVKDLLFRLLYKEDLTKFEELLKHPANQGLDIGKIDNGKNTLLQYACGKEGLEKFIKILLDNRKVNPNETCHCEREEPILIAAFQGNHKALDILVNHDKTNIAATDKDRRTALHKIARMEIEISEEMKYQKSMKILIEKLEGKGNKKISLRQYVNAVDYLGNTALHYAAINLDKSSREAEKLVSTLLSAGAYVGIQNNKGESAILRMKPSLLENYLDESLGTNEEQPYDDDYTLKFDYRMFIPPDTQHKEHAEDLETHYRETETLTYFSENKDYNNLLKHPIVTSFLYLKWHRIRKVFYVNLFFYILFVACITAYILGVYGNDDPNRNCTLWRKLWFCSIFLLLLLVLRELFEFITSGWSYVKNVENWLEITIILLTVAILFNDSAHEVNQQLSAVVILLIWIEFVLLIGRFPVLSTYINMFTAVTQNFLRCLFVYSWFIIAFALSFFLLFRQGKISDNNEPNKLEEKKKNLFDNIGIAILRTVVMLAGEFDFSDLPVETFQITSHIMFFVFLILIPVVLFNLLNGLAVSDTQEIKDKAELLGYVTRVKHVSNMESMFLGKQPFLKKLCRCFQNNNGNYISIPVNNGLCPSIAIFPELNTIEVLVNKGGKIKPRCCSAENIGKAACTMDPRVIESARSVIARRTRYTEMDDIRQRLQNIEECFKKRQI